MIRNLISVYEQTTRRAIIPTPEIVQPRLLVVDIATIAEGIEPAQRFVCNCQGTPGDGFTPRIVLVFYHKCACTVNNSYNIALQIVDISVGIYIKLCHCKDCLGWAWSHCRGKTIPGLRARRGSSSRKASTFAIPSSLLWIFSILFSMFLLKWPMTVSYTHLTLPTNDSV